MIITKASAFRVLKEHHCQPLYITQLVPLEKSVCVRFKNESGAVLTKTFSKAVFYADFAAFRREAGRKRACRPVQDGFKVASSNGGEYQVVMLPSGPLCACSDYKEQVAVWGQGVCLHGYAGLLQLGYESLADYVAAQTALVA